MKSLPPQSTLPDRPNVTLVNADANSVESVRASFRSSASTLARLERRSTLKQLQMPTPELPDLDEWGEDGDESGGGPSPTTERRHSLEVERLNRTDSARRRSQSRQLGSLTETALSGVVMSILHPKAQQTSTVDVQKWWNEIASAQ